MNTQNIAKLCRAIESLLPESVRTVTEKLNLRVRQDVRLRRLSHWIAPWVEVPSKVRGLVRENFGTLKKKKNVFETSAKAVVEPELLEK